MSQTVPQHSNGHLLSPSVVARLGVVGILVITFLTLVGPIILAANPGDLDPTFDGDGIVTTTIDINGVVVSDVAIQPDGKILVAGDGANSIILTRYLGGQQAIYLPIVLKS